MMGKYAERGGKSDLIEALMKDGYTYQDANEAVTCVMDAMVTILRSGKNLTLSNVGTFRREVSSPRRQWNPQTGEHYEEPAKEVVRWTTSPTLNAVLNGRDDRTVLSRKLPKGSLTGTEV